MNGTRGPTFDVERALRLARETLQIEGEAVLALQARVGEDLARAIALLLGCRGRVVVSGMGKSGHVARKIAATLASTGTPSFFVHPAEASHGDLGMVTDEDVLIAVSNSGETEELLGILPIVKRKGTALVAITGNPTSRLALLADVHLDAHVDKEACPLNLAPTASTTAALALGDALAVATLDARGFRREDFARSHPAGALARELLTYVSQVMRTGAAVPSVSVDTPLPAALLEITRKGMAMTAVLDVEGALVGIFTDGDLRRLLERGEDLRARTMGAVMHREPRTIGADRLAVEAARLMETHRINQLLVTNERGALVGAIHIHDLTRAKVI
jgi:arabinose-5-phosphate isomerase